MSLEGRRALVTGSTSGIGEGIAEALAAAGADVMLHGTRSAEEAEGKRAALAATSGRKVGYHSANAADPEAMAGLVQATVDELGGLDILVNNAGIQHVSPLVDFPADRWESIIAINLSSVFYAMQAALPHMKAQKFGRIINIGSAHSAVASPFKTAYCASKFGVAGLSKSAALEVAEEGITVNVLCPGYVLTPLVERQIPDTAKARGITEEQVKRDVLLAAQPTRRFVTPEEIGAFACFLASDAAASVTGALLPVDGGWTTQ